MILLWGLIILIAVVIGGALVWAIVVQAIKHAIGRGLNL